MYDCENPIQYTSNITFLEDQKCYSCINQVVTINVPYDSAIYCQQEQNLVSFNIAGKLHIHLDNQYYSNVYFTQGLIHMKIQKDDNQNSYIELLQDSNCFQIIEEYEYTNIKMINTIKDGYMMQFGIIMISKLQITQKAIVLVDNLVVQQCLNTSDSAQLNISITETIYTQKVKNIIIKQDDEQQANIRIMNMLDTSQVYSYNMQVQVLNVTSSLNSYNITIKELFITQKGKINSTYANITKLEGLSECQLDLSYATIKYLNFSSEIEVPSIRIAGNELIITSQIKTILLSKIIYPQIYFNNTQGIMGNDFYTSMIAITNSDIVFGSKDLHLQGSISGLNNIIILNSTFYDYYSRKLNLEEKIMINNSYVYFNCSVQVSMFSAINSTVIIEESLEVEAIGAQQNNITVNKQSILSSGQFLQSNFTSGSLRVKKYDGIQSVLFIQNLTLQQVIYNNEQESLLDIVAKQIVTDTIYQIALEQFCKINGSLCIDQGASLQSSNIVATSIVANGSMTTNVLLTRLNISVSRLLYAVQEVYVKQIDLFFGTLNRTTQPVQKGYLRLNRSLMIQNFYIDGTQIEINPKLYISSVQPLYTLTVMGVFSESEDSSTQGEFGLFSQQTTIENITNTKGEIYVQNSEIFMAQNSSLFARKILFSGTNATILGYLSLQSNDRLHSTLEMKANNITLGYTVVHGSYSITRQKNCCGASNLIFGGCSQGQPSPLIDLSKQVEYQTPSSGDTCQVNNLKVSGGISGGGILISANHLNLTQPIISDGEQGVCINDYCGGSGSGGNIQINTDMLAFNYSMYISVNGAGCDDSSLSGGAGSAGQVIIKSGQFIQYNQKEQHQAKEDQIQIRQQSGQCHFEALTAVEYCQSLFSVLDTSNMTCIIPWWSVLLIVVISTIIVCSVILAIVCIVTTFRDKQLDKELDITKMSQMNQFVVQLDDLLETTESSE